VPGRCFRIGSVRFNRNPALAAANGIIVQIPAMSPVPAFVFLSFHRRAVVYLLRGLPHRAHTDDHGLLSSRTYPSNLRDSAKATYSQVESRRTL